MQRDMQYTYSADIDKYIENYPATVQKTLQLLRELVHKIVPNITEAMSYGIPTFKFNNKNLVHFAAFENHIGFYPTPSTITMFEKDLSLYKHAKASIQFPIDSIVPVDLIEKMVKFRFEECVNNSNIFVVRAN